MVASEEEEVLGEFDLVAQQQADGLDGLLSPVHIVAQKQVVGVWGVPSVLEYLQQVGKLPVDVA